MGVPCFLNHGAGANTYFFWSNNFNSSNITPGNYTLRISVYDEAPTPSTPLGAAVSFGPMSVENGNMLCMDTYAVTIENNY